MSNTSFLSELFDSLIAKTISKNIGRKFLKTQDTFQEIIDLTLASKGEVSSRKHAENLISLIVSFNQVEVIQFFDHLIANLEINTLALSKAAEDFSNDTSPENLLLVRNSSDSKRLELFRRLASADRGVVWLVSLREKLLSLIPKFPNYQKIDTDLSYLFKEWFNKGFLVLKPINWTTPANILEKIIKYEAVHEIKSWKELRERLDPGDRRCFAFFHPLMEDEPLIFVEVALMKETPSRICDVIGVDRDEIDPGIATTAVFYSISNCQKGLQGISFGNFLIKTVVQNIQNELPSVSNFVTLSPVPNLRKWISNLNKNNSKIPQIEHDSITETYLQPLLRDYFLESKRADKKPNDPVARFHLGNGASLHQINLNGDSSNKGMANSFGVMVNYKYDLINVDKNHESYQNENKIVIFPTLRKWLLR